MVREGGVEGSGECRFVKKAQRNAKSQVIKELCEFSSIRGALARGT